LRADGTWASPAPAHVYLRTLTFAAKATTLSTVGVDVSPHLFRAAGASTAATRAGDNPYLASALLHHSDAGVTSAHYNRATSLTAGDRLRQTFRQYEKK